MLIWNSLPCMLLLYFEVLESNSRQFPFPPFPQFTALPSYFFIRFPIDNQRRQRQRRRDHESWAERKSYVKPVETGGLHHINQTIPPIICQETEWRRIGGQVHINWELWNVNNVKDEIRVNNLFCLHMWTFYMTCHHTRWSSHLCG